MKSVVPLAMTPHVSTTPNVMMMTITLMILTVISRQRWLASDPESFSGGSTRNTSHRFVSGTILRRLLDNGHTVSGDGHHVVVVTAQHSTASGRAEVICGSAVRVNMGQCKTAWGIAGQIGFLFLYGRYL